jgi:hypothetical protein
MFNFVFALKKAKIANPSVFFIKFGYVRNL